jgi:hypothetical protein
MAVFWVADTHSLLEVYQRFTCICCLLHQGADDTTQKTAIFKLSAVRPSNLTNFMPVRTDRKKYKQSC